MKSNLLKSSLPFTVFTQLFTCVCSKNIVSGQSASGQNEVVKTDIGKSIVRATEENKTLQNYYDVFAYQCAVEYPHEPIGDIIYPGDHLGVCVETLHPETYIFGIIDLELLQNSFGGIVSEEPILSETDNVMTDSDCTLENDVGEENSKCFIKTSILPMFFESQLVVNVTGEVDLRMRTKPSRTRKLQLATGPSITSDFVIQANVSKMNNAKLGGTKAMLAGALGLTLLLGIVKCCVYITARKVYRKFTLRSVKKPDDVKEILEDDVQLEENSNCIV